MTKASIKTCSFFGHRHIYDSENRLFELLLYEIELLISKHGYDRFLFGGYGQFDDLAHKAIVKLKEKYPNIKNIYVQAYYKPFDANHMEYLKRNYDEVIYPWIEEKPQKFAITYRNQEMIDDSDFCIFYVRFEGGGAYTTMQYARRKKKNLINIYEKLNKDGQI